MRMQKHLAEALRKHLQDRKPPAIPAGGDLVWKWFCEVSATRSYHSSGPNPISYGEIEAYCRMTGERIEARHVRIIRALDDALIDHYATMSRQAPSDNLPPRSARPISTTLFDAMFG